MSDEKLMQVSDRHHFMPCFYTSLWIKKDGKLVQYSRPYNCVKAERKYPKQVGFVRGLYDLPGVVQGSRSYLEDEFFKPVDCLAAEAMGYMIKNRTTILSDRLSSGFARLLTSFHYRTPDGVQKMKIDAQETMEDIIQRSRKDPSIIYKPEAIGNFSVPEVEEILRRDVAERAWGVGLRDITDSVTTNGAIVNMKWMICELNEDSYPLLTSDKPLVMTNGFAQENGYLSVALGPKRLFIATNNLKTYQEIVSVGSRKLASTFNDVVVKQAIGSVYGSDDSQVRFVKNRLQKRIISM